MSAKIEYLAAAAVAVVLCAVLVPLVKRLAAVWGLLDQPGARKVHNVPLPRIGGIAIVAAWVLSATGVILVYNLLAPGDPLIGPALAVGAVTLAAFALGLADDVFDVPGKYKLLVLLACGATLCALDVRIDAFVFRSGNVQWELGWLSWPVTIVWLVGLTVAINFIDGLDGLAAGIVAITASVLGLAAAAFGLPVVAVGAFALAGALLGFLIYNRHPASVFMGDCGTMALGVGVASLCLLGYGREGESGAVFGTVPALILPALALSIPIVDTMLTLIRRPVLHRRSIFSAERGHIHHRLLNVGLTQRYAVYLLWGATCVAAAVGLLATYGYGWATLAGAALLVPLLVGVFRMAGSVRARETFRALRRNRADGRDRKHWQQAAEESQLRLQAAKTFDAWWEQLCEAAESLSLTSLRLDGVRRDGALVELAWDRSTPPPSDAGMFHRAEHPGAETEAKTISAALPVPQRRVNEALVLKVGVHIWPNLDCATHRLQLLGRLIGEYNVAALVRFDRVRHAKPRSAATASTNGSADLMGAATTPAGQPRVAVVHDFLYTYAGAERVLEQMLEVFPRADLFALFDFLRPDERQFIREKPVTTSFIQRLPMSRTKHRMYLPLMPLAVEQFDFAGYDIILSSSYLAAKGVITRPDQLHVSYCHSPPRWAWDLQHQYLAESGLDGRGWLGGIKSILARSLLHYVRSWDVRSATGVDEFLSNSDFVGRRIHKTYRRNSTTLYPPVDTEAFHLDPEVKRQEFYVTASRMVPYKRIDLIVEAFRQMPGKRLVVIGNGPDWAKIKAIAANAPNVTLVGSLKTDDLVSYMQRAKAFVFAAEEDFGIVPVEAMACGTPVIAFGRGGAVESVIDGTTGILYPQQTTGEIIGAVRRFEDAESGTFDHDAIRSRAERFGANLFREKFKGIVESHWYCFRQQHSLPGWKRLPHEQAPRVGPTPPVDPAVGVSEDEDENEETVTAAGHAPALRRDPESNEG